MVLNCYFPHAKYFGDCGIGYVPLKTRPSLKEVEGSYLCRLTMEEVCQILPSVRLQGDVSGLQKWSEAEDGIVDDVL